MKKLKIKFVLPFILLNCVICFSQPARIFWIDQSYGKIQSAYLNGLHVTDIVDGLSFGEGLAIDSLSDPMKLYYAEAGSSRIVRVNFDGSNPEEVVTGITGLEDIDLDLVNRKVYWLKNTYSDDRIQRADMDSLNSNIEDIFTSSYALQDFRGIGVYPNNQWVFWSQTVYAAVDRISRIKYDGSARTLIGNYLSPRDLDVVGTKIYWSWGGSDLIMRADFDGSNVDTVLTNVNTPFFEVSRELGKIYWTENNKIRCANMDNTGMTDLVTGLGNQVRGIALYYNPATVSVEAKNEMPITYQLKQNYPNPFNPITNIEFRIPEAEFVTLRVYNILGKEVKRLTGQRLAAGMHQFQFDGTNLANGVYMYRIVTENGFVDTKKFLLLK